MKTPPVPAANSNNSTIKQYNDQQEIGNGNQGNNYNDNDHHSNHSFDSPLPVIANYPYLNEINNQNSTTFEISNNIDNEPNDNNQQYIEGSIVQPVLLSQPLYQPVMQSQINPLPQPDPDYINNPQPQSMIIQSEPNDQPRLSINPPIELPHENIGNSPLSNLPFIEIHLSFPEKKTEKTGLFTKKTFISFLITTQPMNYQIRRKYQDFYWLRKTLHNHFPGIFIPPVPIKILKETTSSVDKIERKMKFLEHFLNSLIHNPLLKSSNILNDFLSINQQPQFDHLKNSYDKADMPIINLTKILSQTNNLKLDKSIAETPVLYEEIKSKYQSTQSELVKLNKAFRLLFEDMKQVSTRMTEIATIYQSLAVITAHKASNGLSESFGKLNQLMKNLAYNELKQVMNFNIEFKQYFKYVNEEYGSIKGIYEDYSESKANYLKGKERLNNKKEEYFNKGDIKKWNLNKEDIDNFPYDNKSIAMSKMLPKETEHVDSLQFIYYYYANSFISEFNRLMTIFASDTTKAMNIFLSKTRSITI